MKPAKSSVTVTWEWECIICKTLKFWLRKRMRLWRSVAHWLIFQLFDLSLIWNTFSEDNFLSQFRYWNIFICVNAIRIQCLPIIYELPFPLPLPRVQFVSAIVASLHWCGFHITAWESRGYKKIVVSSKFVVGYSNPFTAFVCNVVVNQGTALRK